MSKRKSTKKPLKRLIKYPDGSTTPSTEDLMGFGMAGLGIIGSMQQPKEQPDYGTNDYFQAQDRQAGMEDASRDLVAKGLNYIAPGVGTGLQAANMIGNLVDQKDQYGVSKSAGQAVIGSILDPIGNIGNGISEIKSGHVGKGLAEMIPGVGGYIQNKDNTKQRGELYNEFATDKTAGEQDAYNQNMKRSEAAYMAEGGLAPANAELELEENAVAPNGEFAQFDGPSHEAGGIPTTLPGDTMVFSDKLKMPGTKKTFAQLNKANNTNKEDKILSDSTSNKKTKTSAELMKKAKVVNSKAIFEAQEELKQTKLTKYITRLGLNQKFTNGGKTGKNVIEVTNPNDPRLRAYQDSMALYNHGVKEATGYKFSRNEIDKTNVSYGRLHKLNGVEPSSIGSEPIKGIAPTVTGPDAFAPQYKKPVMSYVYKKPEPVKTTPVVNYLPQPTKTVNTPVVTPKMPEGNFGFANEPKVPYTQFVKLHPDLADSANWSNYMKDPRGYETMGTKIINTKFKYGGKLPKYLPGGLTNPPYEEGMGTNNPMFDEGYSDSPYIQPTKNLIPVNESMNKTSLMPNSNPSGFDTAESKPSILDWLKKNRPSANTLFNANQMINQNLGEMSYLLGEGKRYDKQALHTYNPSYISGRQGINAIDAQGNMAASNLASASNGNAGAYLSNRIGLGSKMAQTKAAYLENLANTNTGIENQAKQINMQNQYNVDNINNQNKGQALTNYYKAMERLGTNNASLGVDKKQYAMDEYQAGLISQMFPDANTANLELMKYIKYRKSLNKE